ncbi:acyltransferase [Micromonospora sp. WMMA1363]|uniref:phthiocerol/phthiodiolone dimycocerosyl transferase family protein n=1 Tax=Micromonospora sp. WMMA1363 TaxID=3053985 RepID=UPI00259C8DDE|nr:acyltransferase [Micromonospora sp. WMMA1363]MDM4723028.1 acyltransferase [Micromonospora sp. WMMA1363]
MGRDRTWRALAPSEKVHAGKETYIGYAVHATGRLHLDALGTAYDAVCRAYPQLTARIDAGDNGPLFVASDARPDIHACDSGLEHPLAGVELNQHQALSALNVVRDGDATSVCLLTHHSIADAQHSLEILAAVLSCYTDVVRGVPIDLPRRPFPRSLEDLLAERGIGRVVPDDGQTPQQLAVPDQPAVRERDAPARHVVQHRMTAAQTSALVDLGHREHVTINGLLAGVLLLVEAEIRDLPLTELVYRSTANLRSHLTPPVGATEGTNVLGGMGFTATGDIAPDAVTIGRAVSARLRAGLADGSIQRSLLDLLSRPAPDPKPWDPSTAPAVVSMMNWGLVPPMRTPDDLRLTNFHSASSIREITTMGGYVVNTFDSRIGIDLAWPEDDAELPTRVDCLRDRLDHVTLRR